MSNMGRKEKLRISAIVFTAYGGGASSCECGGTALEFLTLHHRGGWRPDRRTPNKAWQFRVWLYRHHERHGVWLWTEHLETMCHCCNTGKGADAASSDPEADLAARAARAVAEGRLGPPADGERRCLTCGGAWPENDVEFPINKTYKGRRYFKSHCRPCYNANEVLEERRLLAEVRRLLGGANPACECCGRTDRLATHWRDGLDGGQGTRKDGKKLYRLILRTPDAVSRWGIMCHNCNCALRDFGECPHRR